MAEIDITFDMRSDAGGKDPDQASPTLRRYHRLLWSRPLPDGRHFTLSDARPGTYLHHHSELGEFFLSSDTVVPTFSGWSSMQPIISSVPAAELEEFVAIRYTIGGMLVFPSNTYDRKPTINGARGFSRSIADRLDLTLECIRRHYLREPNPLAAALDRYADFFALFGDFGGYVDFFLVDDLVTPNGTVDFLLPFDGFAPSGAPKDLASYREYRARSISFLAARNQRIAALGL